MLSYFMSCIAMVRCVLVLRCGLAVVYCYGSMCVGVTLWFGCGGAVSVCSESNLHKLFCMVL